MKIGHVGYFGFGNYGDALFREAVPLALPQGKWQVLPQITRAPYYTEPVATRVGRVDAIVIGGGDLVSPRWMSPLYWKEEYLDKPVFITGVGVPTWQGYTLDTALRLRGFFQHPSVRFVSARDLKSQQWIIKHLQPKVPVRLAADPVCALPFPWKTRKAKKTLGLIVRKQEQPIPTDRLTELLNKAKGWGYGVELLVLGTGEVAQDDRKTAEALNLGPVVAFDTLAEVTQRLAQYSVVASMKFHGCVVPFMMGTPVIALSGADKFVSFLQDTGKSLFRSSVYDEGMADKLINPMYSVDKKDVLDLSQSAKAGLRELGEALRGV